MQIDVSICTSISLRSVSRICIMNINAVKLSYLKKEDRQLEWAKHMDDYGYLRKSVIILDETKFNIHDLMGATVTGIWRWSKRFITVENSESFRDDMERIFMRSDRISFSERKTAERKI